MESLLQDIRYGARQLWRSPAFTVAALATLALGIGANTALFTLGNAIIAKPLAGVLQSDRLLWVTAAHRSGQPATMSYPDFVEYRTGLRALVDLAAVSAGGQFALSSGGDPERVRGEVVSGNYFSILRTPFALGRGFTPAEDSVGKPQPVVVVSYDLWQRRFNGDSGIVGTSVVVNGQPLTIVGVTSRGFNGADLELPRHMWLPMALHDVARPEFAGTMGNRGTWWIMPIGRLKPGVNRDQIEPAARTIATRIAEADSISVAGRSVGRVAVSARHEGITTRVWSAKSGLPPGSQREVTPLAILSGVVTGLVLLIACANVANLLLARAVSRRREVAVRLSLGASRARLVRQLFTESVLLAGAASAAGLLLAFWSTDWLISSGILPLMLDVKPDRAVIAFTLFAAALSAILFGLVPALDSTRGNIASVVREGAQSRDSRRTRLQSTFVVAQISLSLALLTTAGLFLRSMYKARTVDIGFEASSQVLALSFDLGLQRYSEERATAFLTRLSERTLGMPGVERVTFTDLAPLGNRYIAGDIVVEGRTASPPAERVAETMVVNQSSVRPGYFQVLGMRLERGRDFTVRDDKTSPRAVILSERTAKELWPADEPLGKRVSLRGEGGPYLTVIGIVSDVMLGGPTESMRATVYVPQLQYSEAKELTMLVRTSGEPGPLADALRRELRSLDPDLPLFNVRTMAEYKQIKLADRMNGAAILGGFGGLALLLASIGVYGVMAFSVIQRTKEIGIRVALGARRADVISLFLGRGLRLTVIGIVIGMSLSFALSRLLQGMLFGLTPTDAVTFLGVAGMLAGVALLASWLPARGAARVDPMQALRYE
jgi:putative ABC transport system permease protein